MIMIRSNYQKKALGAVVATALLLVVTVVAVAGFSGWFSTYQSDLYTGVETQEGLSQTKIEGVIENQLYIKHGGSGNLSISQITLDGFDCNVSGNFSGSIINVSLSQCINNITTSIPEIVVYTTNQILQASDYVKGDVSSEGSTPSFSDCLAIDGVQLNHSQSYSFYNASSGTVAYSQERTCLDGTVNGSSSFNYSSFTLLSTSLSCTTDSDGDGNIVHTCAVYPMTNTTFEGNLDVDDSNDLITNTTIDYKCYLKDDKSSCESNFIVDGCGSGTVLDAGTGLCWQRDFSTAGQRNWTEAKSYCSALTLGGSSDWTLPSKEELMSLTDLSRSGPAIVGGNSNIFTNVVSSYYWTSTSRGYSSPASHAWTVYFNSGYDYPYGKTVSYYVTCVVRQ